MTAERDCLYHVMPFGGGMSERLFEGREQAVEYAREAPPGTLVYVVAYPIVLRHQQPESPESTWRRVHRDLMRTMRKALDVRGWRCGAT